MIQQQEPIGRHSANLKDFGFGNYRVIYADCPWQFDTWSDGGKDRAPDRHYSTMPTSEIVAMGADIWALSDRKAALLFLWVYQPLLPQALAVMKAWEFTYSTIAFVWVKEAGEFPSPIFDFLPVIPRRGLGYHTRAGAEICLLGVRGSGFKIQSRAEPQVVIEPPREHSRKPDCIREMIARMYDGPRLEMFARSASAGFDAFGNEVEKFS